MKIKFLSLPILLLVALGGCKKDDPCENVNCINGGTCLTGKCDCPKEWTGFNCNQVATPTTIYIKSIALNEFPGDKPDLYLYFFDTQFNQEIRVSETIYQAVPGSTIFYFNPPQKLNYETYFIGNENPPPNTNKFIDGVSFGLNPLFKTGTQIQNSYQFTSTFQLVKGTATVEYEW